MIVTPIERSGVQNPAYRPVAPLSSKYDLQGTMTKLTGIVAGPCAALIMMACATVPPAASPTPANVPATKPAQPALPLPTAQPIQPPAVLSGSWNFAYAPGTYTYTLQTDATVAPVSDTTQKQPLPQSHQTATIAISASGDIQVVNPSPAASPACDPTAALILRAHQLLPRVPNALLAGATWRDSTTTTGCRGMIPAASTVISNYTVTGDTTINSTRVLQILRADSISATGEGSSGQHRILVTATGTGLSHAFLDPITGRLVMLNGTQSTVVNVTTSGRLEQFLQNVTESISLAGFH